MAIKKTAGSKTTAGKKSAPLDPKVADKLLDLLSTDNEFRRLFKKDPEAALSQVGYTSAKAALNRKERSLAQGDGAAAQPSTWCYDVSHIAPKKEIAAARERLKEYLTSQLAPTNPHCFEAGKVSATLKRVKL